MSASFDPRQAAPAGNDAVRLEELPGLSRLYREYVRQSPGIRRFYPCPPEWDSLLGHAGAVKRAAGGARFEALALIEAQSGRFGSGAAARANLGRLRTGQAVAVVARAVPAPFGGPLRLLLGALSAVRLAGRLEQAGTAAVPLLWIDAPGDATEEPVGWLDAEGDFVQSGGPALPPAQPGWDPEALGLLEQCYGAGESTGAALGRLFASFEPLSGLVVVDAGDPEWRRLEAPLLERVEREQADLIPAAEAQDRTLAEAGYRLDGSPGLVRGGAGAGEPALLGPRLVPVLQSMLLPVAAWVGGPHAVEAAARSLPLWSRFGLHPPVVWPRATATMIDSRSRKFLQRYGCTLPDLFAGGAALTALEQRLDPELAERFDTVAREVDRRVDALRAQLGGSVAAPARVDPDLAPMIETSRSKLLYQIQKLKDRAVAAQQERRQMVARQLRRAGEFLAPGGGRQEERLGLGYFLLRYSRRFPELVAGRMDFETFEHQLVPLD